MRVTNLKKQQFYCHANKQHHRHHNQRRLSFHIATARGGGSSVSADRPNRARRRWRRWARHAQTWLRRPARCQLQTKGLPSPPLNTACQQHGVQRPCVLLALFVGVRPAKERRQRAPLSFCRCSVGRATWPLRSGPIRSRRDIGQRRQRCLCSRRLLLVESAQRAQRIDRRQRCVWRTVQRNTCFKHPAASKHSVNLSARADERGQKPETWRNTLGGK